MEKFRTFFMALSVEQRDAFAARCKTRRGPASRRSLENICYGKDCGESLAICIERESQGAVTVEDLRPDVDWAFIRGTAEVAHAGS